MHTVLLSTFWTCSLLLIYVYLLYPLLVRALASRFGVPVARAEIAPSVTVIVSAYNEERNILDKLANLARLDYPADRLDIMVVSDASSDRTEELARSYSHARVQVLRVEGRRGKTQCQNVAAAAAGGEILIFTDATTKLDPGTARRLVAYFADPKVGCVAGRLVYVTPQANATGRGNEAYWDHELRLRAAESALGSLIGVSGCLYAVRRSAYRPLEPEICSDFAVAMTVREQGLRTVLAPEALCYEETLAEAKHELTMRVRVGVQGIEVVVRQRRFLNPFRYGVFAWQLWSHKVLRFASPLLWLGALLTNLLLAGTPAYFALLLCQLALLGAGVAGFALQSRWSELGVLGRPYYLLLTNLAYLAALAHYARGERMVTWTPMR